MTRYYSTQRPILPGGFPNRGKVEQIKNFDTKIFCEEIGEEAWGFVDYIEPLKKRTGGCLRIDSCRNEDVLVRYLFGI